MNELAILKLGCVGCGASLEIDSTAERLACIHCGTQQIVYRTGGAVHLREVVETLSRVRVGTDKTAAELAIVRLTKEQDELILQRRHYENQIFNQRHYRNQYWTTQINARSQSMMIATLFGIGGGIVLGIIVSIVVGNILSGLFGPGGVQAAFFIALIVVLALSAVGGVGAYKMFEKQVGSTADLASKRDSELTKLDAQMNATRFRYDEQLRHYTEQIQRNREIANS